MSTETALSLTGNLVREARTQACLRSCGGDWSCWEFYGEEDNPAHETLQRAKEKDTRVFQAFLAKNVSF